MTSFIFIETHQVHKILLPVVDLLPGIELLGHCALYSIPEFMIYNGTDCRSLHQKKDIWMTFERHTSSLLERQNNYQSMFHESNSQKGELFQYPVYYFCISIYYFFIIVHHLTTWKQCMDPSQNLS